jgi:DNA-directed RNA polymerase specialized sigma24 family protein
MNDKSELRAQNSGETSTNSQVCSDTISAILQYRRVLHSLAYRVLFSHNDAEDAVCNLFLAVSRNVPRFECDGSFRSWLLRSLIDEALDILHKRRIRPPICTMPILNPHHVLPASETQPTKDLRVY